MVVLSYYYEAREHKDNHPYISSPFSSKDTAIFHAKKRIKEGLQVILYERKDITNEIPKS